MVVPQNLDRVIGHQAIPQLCSPCTHVSLNTLLCIGNCLLICDDNTMDMVIHVLPQVHCRFHIDEAGVFAELPVRVVGDPPFPVMGVNHFLKEAWLLFGVVLLFPLSSGSLQVLNSLLL